MRFPNEKELAMLREKYPTGTMVRLMDNETLICTDCSTREALDAIGVSAEEQEKIISIIHRNYAE
ncbi:MAG: hypothetical protein NC485_00265 [Ruminococcus flavefaciens]|nr:hypothetical protein [Ruminococcus flavefaciens]